MTCTHHPRNNDWHNAGEPETVRLAYAEPGWSHICSRPSSRPKTATNPYGFTDLNEM